MHTHLLEQIPGLFSVVNRDSQITYTNHKTAQAYGFSNQDEAAGKTIYDLKSPVVEFATQVIEQDQKVMRENNRLLILDVHLYPDNTHRVLLSEKSPLQINSKIAGCIFRATEINNAVMLETSRLLHYSDKQYYAQSGHHGRSYVIGDTMQKTVFTPRQMDCLFYLLRGQSAKAIAKHLNLSPRTVEAHIESMKSRANCDSKSQLIEYAIEKGLIHYLPCWAIANKNKSGPSTTS